MKKEIHCEWLHLLFYLSELLHSYFNHSHVQLNRCTGKFRKAVLEGSDHIFNEAFLSRFSWWESSSISPPSSVCTGIPAVSAVWDHCSQQFIRWKSSPQAYYVFSLWGDQQYFLQPRLAANYLAKHLVNTSVNLSNRELTFSLKGTYYMFPFQRPNSVVEIVGQLFRQPLCFFKLFPLTGK